MTAPNVPNYMACARCGQMIWPGVDHFCPKDLKTLPVPLVDSETKAVLKGLTAAIEDLTDKVSDLVSQIENYVENND